MSRKEIPITRRQFVKGAAAAAAAVTGGGVLAGELISTSQASAAS